MVARKTTERVPDLHPNALVMSEDFDTERAVGSGGRFVRIASCRRASEPSAASDNGRTGLSWIAGHHYFAVSDGCALSP